VTLVAVVAIAGSHGLIGTALMPALRVRGDRVIRMVRRSSAPGPDEIVWDPDGGHIAAARLEGLDAVINLAGENIAAGRWTAERKVRIRESRVRGTRLLAETLLHLERPPGVFIAASAIGYYGDRGGEVVREDSPPGTGFIAGVCREWEAAADPARRAGIRVVHLRSGLVLSPRGGVLAKLLPMFRLGLGGPLGSGRQHMSWIAIDDHVGAVLHVLVRAEMDGPVNLVAPHPVTNREFTRTLGALLSRPALLAVPAVMLRAALGEMAAEVLGGARVEPAKLLGSGFAFRYPDLESGLRHLLAETRRATPPPHASW
jgi:uncharacterized protein